LFGCLGSCVRLPGWLPHALRGCPVSSGGLGC
jgi:hypothetical protein